jgi:acetyltransferase
MYMESVRDGRRFLEIAGRVAAKKPVLVLKSGRTQEGARAAASHTGSLTVDDRVFEAACRQAGIIRLEKFNELFELPKIFACQPQPRSNRLGIVSFTGGVGVLSTDEGAKYGLEIARLSSVTAGALEEIFPGLGKIPVDIGPLAAYKNDFMLLYPKILGAVLADDNVDCLFNVLWVNPTGAMVEGYLKTYAELQDCQKPIATWIYSPSSPVRAELTLRLEELGFPVYNELEAAIKALGLACQYAQRRKGEA